MPEQHYNIVELCSTCGCFRAGKRPANLPCWGDVFYMLQGSMGQLVAYVTSNWPCTARGLCALSQRDPCHTQKRHPSPTNTLSPAQRIQRAKAFQLPPPPPPRPSRSPSTALASPARYTPHKGGDASCARRCERPRACQRAPLPPRCTVVYRFARRGSKPRYFEQHRPRAGRPTPPVFSYRDSSTAVT